MARNIPLATQLKAKMEHHRRMAEVYEAAWRAETGETARNGTSATANKNVSEAALPSDPGRDWVRTACWHYRQQGLTAAEIRELAEKERGAVLSKGFPYTTLWKLKQMGEVIEKSGRYIPTEKMKKVSVQ